MSRVPYTIEQLKKLGLVEKDGVYVPVKSLVVKNPKKIEPNPQKTVDGDYEEKLVKSIGMGLYGADLIPAMDLNKLHNALNPEKSANKKVLNATKTEVDGIIFDSKLEAYMYTLLRGAGMTFEMQKEFVLQKAFRYNGEAVRAIKSYVDFYLPNRNVLIDCKGYANDVAPMKFKMLKSYLKHIEDRQPTIEMPKNKQECDLLLNRLMYNFYEP